MSEHSVIYLSPSDDPEREWCQDDVWENSVRYNLGTDFDRVTAERDAALASIESADASAQTLHEVIARLQQRLTAADERADFLEGLLWEYVDRDEVTNEWARDWLSAVTAALKPAEGGGDVD
ncbi:hypothetical protein FX985_03319 [Pseudomonas extremaustralis]|uniref:Uncharacterized protein n=1 Tax=Pseudomonas extremaustralis TaxID=359110 RepID=A0A5M9J336_9PSED|nr:hypothetical protein [Pseudomonas extremaustralis]KAA8563251.1 hypothetical protein FX985_03319 [Pseudomonas extremaustralis]